MEAGSARFANDAPDGPEADSVIRRYMLLESAQAVLNYACVVMSLLVLAERLVAFGAVSAAAAVALSSEEEETLVQEVRHEERVEVFAAEYAVLLVLLMALLNAVRRAYAAHHSIETTVKYKRA